MTKALCTCLSVVFWGAPVLADVVTFDNAADLTSRFNINGTNNNLAAATTGGIAGSGGVQVLPGRSAAAVQLSPFFPLNAGTTLTAEIFWKYNDALRDPFNGGSTINVGFAASQNDRSVQYARATIFAFPSGGVGAGVETINAGIASGNKEFPITGNWYKTTLGFTEVGGPFNQYDFWTNTWDYGPDGISTPTPMPNLSVSRTVGSATLGGVSGLYAGFTSNSAGGVEMLDNFYASVAVPEPGACSLVALGFVGVFQRRIRRRA